MKTLREKASPLHGFSEKHGFVANGRPAAMRQISSRILDLLGDLEPIYFDKEQFHTLHDKETTLQQELLIVENTPEIVISWD